MPDSLLFVSLVALLIVSIRQEVEVAKPQKTKRPKCITKTIPFCFQLKVKLKNNHITCVGFSGLHKWGFSCTSKYLERLPILGEVDIDKAVWEKVPSISPDYCSPEARPPCSLFYDQDEWPCCYSSTAFLLKFRAQRGNFYFLTERWVLMLKSIKPTISILRVNLKLVLR